MDEKNFQTRIVSNEKDVITFYDEYAATWDTRFNESFATRYFFERRWRSFEKALTKYVSSTELAIELGVGTGPYIERTAAIFKKVIAIDGSENMLSLLANNLEEKNVKNVALVRANVVDLSSIESGTTSFVYFFGLIEHIIDLFSFVNEIRRILTPNGILIGVTPNGISPWYSIRQALRGTGKHCSSDRYYTENSLDQIFLPVGFKKVFVDYWGAVPAGIDDRFAKMLYKLEPFMERSPLKKMLGGLTFVYRSL